MRSAGSGGEGQLPLDLDVRPQRLESAATERREQLTTELEHLVEAPDDLRPDLAGAGAGIS